jgi:uncharacterized Ntn-hydrolase superfamily protein
MNRSGRARRERPIAVGRTARAFRFVILALPLAASAAWARHEPATFSIVAYDSVTQELGVAVQSKYFSVGRVVPWAEAGVGAVATQATVNPSYGIQGLAMLRSGLTPAQILAAMAVNDSLWPSRQVALVDARGNAATWTGPKCIDWAGGESGPGFACQGNILAGPAVVAEMSRAYRAARGELAERLLAAMEAGQKAGGDKRGMQSMALIVVRPSTTHPEFAHRYIDLRVEDHKDPFKEMRRLLQIHHGFHGVAAHLDYAEQYEREGRRELAVLERNRVRETIERALARNEKDASMLNGLAWACATRDIFLDEARRAAERAVALEPRNTDILDTLAEVYFRSGDPKRAIEVETRASRIDPKSQYLKDQIERFRRAGTP